MKAWSQNLDAFNIVQEPYRMTDSYAQSHHRWPLCTSIFWNTLKTMSTVPENTDDLNKAIHTDTGASPDF